MEVSSCSKDYACPVRFPKKICFDIRNVDTGVCMILATLTELTSIYGS